MKTSLTTYSQYFIISIPSRNWFQGSCVIFFNQQMLLKYVANRQNCCKLGFLNKKTVKMFGAHIQKVAIYL